MKVKKTYTKKTCNNCRDRNKKCIYEKENYNTCINCDKYNLLCIRYKPSNADLEITRLTQELEEHRIQIENLEARVSRLERDTHMIKINLQQRRLLDAQLEDLIN